MAAGSPVVGVVGSAAGGVEDLRNELVEPLAKRGCTVAVTLTPDAYGWLSQAGEIEELERLTGLPVRAEPRLPTEASPHPRIDVFIVAPASANTVAKLALGWPLQIAAFAAMGYILARNHTPLENPELAEQSGQSEQSGQTEEPGESEESGQSGHRARL